MNKVTEPKYEMITVTINDSIKINYAPVIFAHVADVIPVLGSGHLDAPITEGQYWDATFGKDLSAV